MPTVSIILPTYNRARFIPEALASIRAQTFTDYELIVVDDGGTDETASLVPFGTYIWQENGGPASARNLGVKLARGHLVAFYDSDDLGEPCHLKASVAALEANSDVDWVYASFRRAKYQGGVIVPDAFAGQPFRRLRAERRGDLRIFEHPLRCAIEGGLCVGLRSSVVRRRLLEHIPFPPYRIGEDQALVVRAIACGARFAYLDAIHATARSHDANTSGSSAKVMRELVRALESLRDLPLDNACRRALNRRIAHEAFWGLGYHHGDMNAMLKALRLHPSNLKFWKSALTTTLRQGSTEDSHESVMVTSTAPDG